MATIVGDAIGVTHPLEPLSVEEIAAAVNIVRAQRNLGERVRFVTITLHEPPKGVVLAFKPGQAIERQAFMVLLDTESGVTYEAVVSLTNASVDGWEPVPGVQPA